MEKFGKTIDIVRGFHYGNNRLGRARVPGSIIAGSNVLIRGNGKIKSAKPAGITGLTGASNIMLVGSTLGGIGSGTVVQGPGGSIYAVGSGTAFGAGASIAAAAFLQFWRLGTLYTAGLHPPLACNLFTTTAIDPFSTKSQGSYSVRLTKKRTDTGFESNPGPISAVINTKASDGRHHKIKCQFPSDGEAFDKFGVYVTLRDYGAIGPQYWWNDLIRGYVDPDIGTPGYFYLDINDSDLDFNTLPPTDHFYPPTGAFFFFLGNVAVIVGTFGGTGMSPSIPGVYEGFPPTYTTFLPEAPIGVRGRATDGWVYILCRNSLNAAILSGSEITPVIPRTIWPEVGVANGNAAAMSGSGLYVWSGQLGAARTNGDSNEPDTSFAAPVQAFFEDNGWGSNVIVGADYDNDAIIYINGSQALAYHKGLDEWSTPIDLGASGVSAVTYQGKAHISDGASVYTFNTGTPGGGYAWYCIPSWDDADLAQLYKIITSIQGSGSNGVNIDLLINEDAVTSQEQLTLNGTHSNIKPTYVRDVRSYTVKASGNAAGQTLEQLLIRGLMTPMRV